MVGFILNLSELEQTTMFSGYFLYKCVENIFLSYVTYCSGIEAFCSTYATC